MDTGEGDVQPAGQGMTDEEMVQQVSDQTSSDLREADVFKREEDGAATDTEAAKATGDEFAGND